MNWQKGNQTVTNAVPYVRSCKRKEFLLGVAATACAGFVGTLAAGVRDAGAVRIAHCGDPQFGFCVCKEGPAKAYRQDLERFERAIDIINSLKPDLCFIAGDMTHNGDKVVRDWPRLVKLFKVPFVVAPGNHDMGQKLERKNVERFRRVFGYDYVSTKVGRWRFVCGNSQYWYPTDEKEMKEAYETWFRRELAEAKTNGEPVIVGTHIPPFMRMISEPDDYENCPKAMREQRFDLYVQNGVRFYLAGHTHRMVARAHRGITILNAETTCRNFDDLPFGFRMLTLCDDGTYSWDFNPIGG